MVRQKNTVIEKENTSTQSFAWLVMGLVLGLLGVLASILTPSWDETANIEMVAVVNGTSLSREKYLAYLQALAADKKDPISSDDSKYVLQRMIEEELLIQRGVEVGLLESDKRVRAAMVNGMISMTTASAEAKAPSEEDLAQFFADNIDYFTPTARLRARVLALTGKDAEQRASQAYQRLVDGDDFWLIDRELGSPVALSVPDSLLPPTKLREYLGPTLTQMLMKEAAGFVSRPQPIGDGFRIVQLVEMQAGLAPALEEVSDQLEAEYVRRAGDLALREYLEWLKDRADISYPSELPL